MSLLKLRSARLKVLSWRVEGCPGGAFTPHVSRASSVSRYGSAHVGTPFIALSAIASEVIRAI